MGKLVISTLRQILNPLFVFNLSEGGPSKGYVLLIFFKLRFRITLMNLNQQYDWRVLACGGDGTVAWILSEIDKFTWTNPPAVRIEFMFLCSMRNYFDFCVLFTKK